MAIVKSNVLPARDVNLQVGKIAMEVKTNSKKIVLFSVILLISTIRKVLSSTKDVFNNRKHIISTEGCKIPAFPIISNNFEKLMVPPKNFNCSKNIHLLDSNSSHIWILEEFLDFYNVLNTKDFYCCYRNFYAGDNIAQINYGTCIEFTKAIRAKHEFTRVECFYLDSKIYDDFFLFPLFTRPKVVNGPRPDFNVLMFGIESMSRLNFLRTMPKTSKFLQEKGSIQLLGYNKVGDNSFPNLFPLLFGKSYEQVKLLCIQETIIDFDKCVTIWTFFKAAGYQTALASDSVAGLLGTYEYSLPLIPTDFYLQPFIFETRNIFKYMFYNFHHCLRNKYFYKLLLNWSSNLLKFSNNKIFGLFWEESVSHENFNLPQSMDDYHYSFFKELENSKHLDNSIVILFSDHGMRYGKITQTEQGRVESRLPLFEILFPRQFQYRYPLAFKNVKDNRYRLTTPYDIHETLIDITQKNFDDSEIKKRSKMITRDTKNISLFLPITAQRRCETIGIEEHWCTCQKTEPTLLEMKRRILATNYIINYINAMLKKYPQCYQLKVQKILNAMYVKVQERQNLIYNIVLETLPGGGLFDATIQEINQELSISGTISRLNLYRHTSQCIHDVEVKMYCTCKSI